MQQHIKSIKGLLALGLFAASVQNGFAADEQIHQHEVEAVAEQDAGSDAVLNEVVVTAPRSHAPLTVKTDPKTPRQPMPAHDGADYLKSIPGFNVIRKGGTDGDPVFRGMAGSRLNILLDGEMLLGGCGMRMDPPTAYIFPAAYDQMTVLKGPQTVAYGPGNSAGVVLFERDVKRFKEPGVKVNSTLTAGSFGRHDEMLDLRAGMPQAYAQMTATNSHSGDYKDGNGIKVHSNYTRWSANAALGWTPDDDTLLELSGAKSDGEAAYADRAMDGAKFARDNVGVKIKKDNISSVLMSLEGQAYYNYIDHVMDNYSVRNFTPTMMMPNPAVSNPDRETTGGKMVAGIALGDAADAHIGFDIQRNIHTSRVTMNQVMMPYQNMARTEDMRFRNYGFFADVTADMTENDRLLAGARVDKWRVQDKRSLVTLMMGMTAANPTANQTRNETLSSGFVRYEHDLTGAAATLYAGFGRSVRFPDYWELMKESTTSVSSFNTRPEKTNQADIGLNYNGDHFQVSVSAFYSKIKDFNLIQSGVMKPTMMGTRMATVTRNIDATTMGGEASVAWMVADNWKLDGSIAYVYGKNDTDTLALGQMPPLEGTIGINYDNRTYSAGALARMVAAQNRFAANQGNIVGQDLGRTSGFSVLSLHAGWKPSKNIQLTAGVDNLLDRVYAEHISRSGATIPGYDTTTRVNEMGRSLWLSANLTF